MKCNLEYDYIILYITSKDIETAYFQRDYANKSNLSGHEQVVKSISVSVPSLPVEVAPSTATGNPKPTVIILSYAIVKALKNAPLSLAYVRTSAEVGGIVELSGLMQPIPPVVTESLGPQS